MVCCSEIFSCQYLNIFHGNSPATSSLVLMWTYCMCVDLEWLSSSQTCLKGTVCKGRILSFLHAYISTDIKPQTFPRFDLPELFLGRDDPPFIHLFHPWTGFISTTVRHFKGAEMEVLVATSEQQTHFTSVTFYLRLISECDDRSDNSGSGGNRAVPFKHSMTGPVTAGKNVGIVHFCKPQIRGM